MRVDKLLSINEVFTNKVDVNAMFDWNLNYNKINFINSLFRILKLQIILLAISNNNKYFTKITKLKKKT